MDKINALKSIWDGFDFTYLLNILLSVIPALVCITLHELSHGFVAYKLGDDTAKNAGRLTLNPIKHLDIMGLIMMVVFHFGWAKPVPVNMYKFKDPKRGMAITALAGPVSNILITIVFAVLYGLLYIPLQLSDVGAVHPANDNDNGVYKPWPCRVQPHTAAPAGWVKGALSLMSDESYYKLMRYERYGGLVLMVLMMTGVLGKPVSTVVYAIYSNLIPVAQFACDLVVKLFYKWVDNG